MTFFRFSLLVCVILWQSSLFLPEPISAQLIAKPPKSTETTPAQETDVKEPEPESPEERRDRIHTAHQNGIGSLTNLISIPQIQEELKLTEVQRKEMADQMKSLQLYLRLQFKDVRKLPRTEQAARIRELQQQTASLVQERQGQIIDILSEEQKLRLSGISMQFRGVKSLLDKRIADLLKLTEKQREELLNIVESLEQDLQAEREKHQNSEDPQANQKTFQAKLKELQTEAEAQMLEVLTRQQKADFQKLQGEKFQPRTPTLGKPPTPIAPPLKNQPKVKGSPQE